MSKTLLSIVIPTFNQSISLELTLYWLTQVLPEKSEVIVIDDQSDENIHGIVYKYRTALPILYCRNPKKGRAAARNLGVELSEGQRILFNDSDRFPADTDLSPHRDRTGVIIGQIKEFYFSRPKEMVERLKYDFDSIKTKSRMPRYPEIIRKYLFDDNGKQDTNVPWLGFLSGHVSVPRDAFRETRGFDENFMEWGVEHFELGYRLAKAGLSFFQTHTENYHIAHPRPDQFYRTHLLNSFDYFKRKHSDDAIRVFEKFMFGVASLQDVESASKSYRKINWIERNKVPVMMRLLGAKEGRINSNKIT